MYPERICSKIINQVAIGNLNKIDNVFIIGCLLQYVKKPFRIHDAQRDYLINNKFPAILISFGFMYTYTGRKG